MENDYLWDKIGEDAEIEELEKTLQVFRYQESNAPKLPAKIVETKPKFSLLSLRFALSFATCIALLIGGFFVWSKLSTKQDLALTAINQNSSKTVIAPINVAPIQIVEKPPKQEFVPKPFNISYRQKVSAPVISKIKSKRIAPKVKLTDEEQYAYDQLMLALSITGSKLKEVQDKVNGGEETTSVIKSLK
ncbi:MAG TPA: hypothetical protein PKY82_29625 [Pyrinomonadaceae bacterium]|nr:hypothetical protein [Pyrinomonadaceae bacterium]